MIVIVTTPFVGEVCGRTFNMPAPGTLLDVPENLAYTLIGMNVAQAYGQKIMPVPPVTKKKRSESSLADPVRRPPTRLRWPKFVTK